MPSRIPPEFTMDRHGRKLCDCGCGDPAPIAPTNNLKWGHVKGQPMRYIRGHGNRKHDFGYKEDENGCWIFSGYTNSSNGYGYIGGKPAHRIYYEKHIGPIPEGLHIDHLCRVRACVNPAHLEPVTCKENIRRSPTIGRGVSPARKLTHDQVREIRTLDLSNRRIGRLFNVSRECVRNIKNGRQYKDVI